MIDNNKNPFRINLKYDLFFVTEMIMFLSIKKTPIKTPTPRARLITFTRNIGRIITSEPSQGFILFGDPGGIRTLSFQDENLASLAVRRRGHEKECL
jgi:hypothetical protein